jgi:hypothetical protein|tara:strand:+ start:3009 stop:3203 length:195 start_codon:yes stop_codon:yes gene_type:complete
MAMTASSDPSDLHNGRPDPANAPAEKVGHQEGDSATYNHNRYDATPAGLDLLACTTDGPPKLVL